MNFPFQHKRVFYVLGLRSTGQLFHLKINCHSVGLRAYNLWIQRRINPHTHTHTKRKSLFYRRNYHYNRYESTETCPGPEALCFNDHPDFLLAVNALVPVVKWHWPFLSFLLTHFNFFSQFHACRNLFPLWLSHKFLVYEGHETFLSGRSTAWRKVFRILLRATRSNCRSTPESHCFSVKHYTMKQCFRETLSAI